MSSIIAFISIALATIFLMEGVAWIVHRYVMHGALWSVHRTHHYPRKGWFELNDVFGLVFSLPSIALIYFGLRGASFLLAVGCGIALYGVVYFFLHDMLVHRRIDTGLRPKSGYLARIYQAHRLHHAVEQKNDCVSFGFIIAPSPKRLKKMLKETAPRRAEAAIRDKEMSSAANL